MKLSFTSLSPVAFLIASAFIAPPGLAHEGGNRGQLFEKVDANKDGKVTRKEAHTMAHARFAEVDTNGDKIVTPEEAQKRHEAKKQEHAEKREKKLDAKFKGLDANGDGKLTKTETKIDATAFGHLDKNADGAISQAEFSDSRNSKRQAHAKNEGHHGQKNGNGAKSRGAAFDKVDANNDGKIAVNEATLTADEFFSRIDKNGDNVITSAEAEKAMKRRDKHRRDPGHGQKSPPSTSK